MEKRIEEMGDQFDEHAPNHEGFVEAYLEWKLAQDEDGESGKEGFAASNGTVFEVKVYKAKKVAVNLKEGKGKAKAKEKEKKVPPKLDLRPPTEPSRRGLRVNHRGQVQSRAAPHPLTPYPTESSLLPNDLGLLNEVDEPVPGARGAAVPDGGTARAAATASAAAANAGAGRRVASPRRRRYSSTYSSGTNSDSESDGMDVLMDTAASIIQRTRPATGTPAPALSEASVATSVATEEAEAAAALVGMERGRGRERGDGWHRRGRGGVGA